MPIDPLFADDFSRFVLQRKEEIPIQPLGEPKKPFSLPKADKAKEEKKKEKRYKSPWDPTFQRDINEES